jgi:putative Holliday junction resolvase
MKLLAIDHGLRRIGLATCDASGLIARELTIIDRRSKVEDFEKINQLAAQEQAAAIVIGLPTNYEAHEGQQSQAKSVEKWAAQLQETTALPIIFWDEQLSSADARELAQAKKRKPRDPIDDLAARVILQSYLDAVRDGLAELPNVSTNQ